MDSTDLNFFTAVATAGGIGRAANELHTVQSNVTQRIRALEDQLGVQLFHRSKKGVTLTSMGSRLLPYANRISELLAEAHRAVKDEAFPSGELRIGSMETTAALRLPPLLTQYAIAYPDVDVQIETGPTAILVDNVVSRKLDGAFVSAPITHGELACKPIVEEELVLITSPMVLSAEHLAKFLATGSGRKVIVFRAGCSYRQRLSEYLAHRGFVDLRWMEMGTLDGIIGCVAASVGISLIPRVVAEPAERQGLIRLHPLPDGTGKATTVFIHRQDTFVSSALRAFIECAGSGAKLDPFSARSVSVVKTPQKMT
ncbi:LysR substrate-binding domain-containing protein [Bradyrhizobium barranii]|uniref:LysR substrate-binding domain-containing protein n=1 Tax=Bradyrhizobium barranii TaxID=2992140 RepID=A0ABY3QR08_9BRAD|nr:LysR family transcriptional regulator [Bradyrhizobium japonicum]UFW88450.1 LysR substrate-binding domain-containing protein [Bradyrhizobium japonicum]